MDSDSTVSQSGISSPCMMDMMSQVKVREKPSRSSTYAVTNPDPSPSENRACSSNKPGGLSVSSAEALTSTVESTASTNSLTCSSRVRPTDSSEPPDRNRVLLNNLSAMGLPNSLSAYATLVDLPTSMRLLHPLFQNSSDFAYEFDSDGILRNVHTGETLAMKVAFTGAAVKRQEMIRAICTRQVRQRLFDLNMESSQIPIPGHPTLCMRVIHSSYLFTHRGPVLIVLQAGGVSHAGVWANRLLLHPQQGLKTGSQLELIRRAHARGFAVALINANEHVPSEAEMDAMEFVSALCPTASGDGPGHTRRSGLNLTPTTVESGPTAPHPFRVPRLSTTIGTRATRAMQPVICTSLPNETSLPKSSSDSTNANASSAFDPTAFGGYSSVKGASPSSKTPTSLSNSALYTLFLSNSATTDGVAGGSGPGTSQFTTPNLIANPVQSLTSSISSHKESHETEVAGSGLASRVHVNGASTSYNPTDNAVSRESDTEQPVSKAKCDTSSNDETDFTRSETKTTVSIPTTDQMFLPCSFNSSMPRSVPTAVTNSLITDSGPSKTFSCPAEKCARDATGEPFILAAPQAEIKMGSSVRVTPWSWPTRSVVDHSLDISPEDRLYGIWRQLIPHLASDQICVWAHQQGGHALIHPLKPMPGLWPGFSDYHPPCVSPSANSDCNTTQSKRMGSFQSEATCAVTTAPVPHSMTDAKESLTGSCALQTPDATLPNPTVMRPDGTGPLFHGRQSMGFVRSRAYVTRKRHLSANAILSTCPSSTLSEPNTVSHRTLRSIDEKGCDTTEPSCASTMHSAELGKSQVQANQLPSSVNMAVPDVATNPIPSVSETPTQVSSSEPDQMPAKSEQGHLWIDRRVYGPWRQHVSPGAARRAFRTPIDESNDAASRVSANAPHLVTDYGCTTTSTLPPFSGNALDTESFARHGGLVSRHVGIWATGDKASETAHSTDASPRVGDPGNVDADADKKLGLRLARAWQRKARRLFDELSTRVKCIVFTDCPTVLDLAMEGVGWGLNLLQDQPVDTGDLRLFEPSVIRSSLPERVIQAREWFAKHSVHFVATDTPIGTRLDEGARRAHQIPVLSAGTTEHDLIPSSVLDTAFDIFDSKLSPTDATPSSSSPKPTSVGTVDTTGAVSEPTTPLDAVAV